MISKMLLLGMDPFCKYLMKDDTYQLKLKNINVEIENIAYELFEMRIEDIICKLTDIEVTLELKGNSRLDIKERIERYKQELYNRARLARIEAKVHLHSVHCNMIDSPIIDESLDACILRYIKSDVIRRHKEWVYNRT